MRAYGTSALILIGLLTIALFVFSQPSTAVASLPPRPTLTPTTVSPPPLAAIILHAGVAYNGAWTIVQWQGGAGDWNDVTGWQAHVSRGQVRWRVAEKDLATGPFRWVVYDQPGGSIQALSPSFNLPSQRDESITVSLDGQ